MRNLPAILVLIVACTPAWVLAAGASPLASLSDAEQSYYTLVFNYTMDVVKTGEKYDWSSYSGKGSITADKLFVSKSGYNCRNFTEAFTVQGRSGNSEGVACKRQGNDGWCRLKPDNALTCAMEDPANMFDGVSVPNVTVTPISGGDGNVDADVNLNVDTNVNTNIDTGSNNRHAPTGSGVADTVTGSAGKAAGTATGAAVGWFGKTFGR